MADSYGTLIFTKSLDCAFVADDLLQKLNSYNWGQDETKWCYDTKIGDIFASKICTQNPSLFPDKTIRSLIQVENDTEQWVEGAADDVDPDKIIDVEISSEIELSSLCADISNAISSGWIEIGLVANVKRHYGYFQKLKIHANGEGMRSCCATGDQFSNGMDTEYV